MSRRYRTFSILDGNGNTGHCPSKDFNPYNPDTIQNIREGKIIYHALQVFIRAFVAKALQKSAKFKPFKT